MNPASRQRPPLNPLPRLVDRRVQPPALTAVSLTRGLPPTRLTQAEQTWNPARAALAATLRAAGFGMESGHWDWRNKLGFVPPGWHCLVAVEAEGEVQGLMAVETALRPSHLDPSRWVVYVDFLEVAPWNRREPADRAAPAIQSPRFAGVGALLLSEAVRMSMGQSARGCVSLHSLPSAEEFYESRCGMTRVGPDPTYYDLVHFEYPEGAAARWLTAAGFSA